MFTIENKCCAYEQSFAKFVFKVQMENSRKYVKHDDIAFFDKLFHKNTCKIC